MAPMIAVWGREARVPKPCLLSKHGAVLSVGASRLRGRASSSVYHRQHVPSGVRRVVILVPLLIITLTARDLLNFRLLSEPIPARECPCPSLVMRNKPEIARGDQAPSTDQARVTVRVANQCWRLK